MPETVSVPVPVVPEKKREASLPPAPPPEAKKEVLDEEGLDELIRFINGGEDEKEARAQSAKAAKRARQKQRKVSLAQAYTLVRCALSQSQDFLFECVDVCLQIDVGLLLLLIM